MNKKHIIECDEFQLRNPYLTNDISISHKSSQKKLVFKSDVKFNNDVRMDAIRIGRHWQLATDENGDLLIMRYEMGGWQIKQKLS